MTDQTEITPEGMRCLLQALGAVKPRGYYDFDIYGFPDRQCYKFHESPEWWIKNGTTIADLDRKCLRFLESEKFRGFLMSQESFKVFFTHKPGWIEVTDPDPAVRIVKAAIVAAIELEKGK